MVEKFSPANKGNKPRMTPPKIAKRGGPSRVDLAVRLRPPVWVAGSLFVRDSHFLDHARIFGELIARQDAEFLRRAAPYGKSQLFELAANFTVAERLENLGVQPTDDLLGHSNGRQHRKP